VERWQAGSVTASSPMSNALPFEGCPAERRRDTEIATTSPHHYTRTTNLAGRIAPRPRYRGGTSIESSNAAIARVLPPPETSPNGVPTRVHSPAS
jgi:hypothetical protein